MDLNQSHGESGDVLGSPLNVAGEVGYLDVVNEFKNGHTIGLSRGSSSSFQAQQTQSSSSSVQLDAAYGYGANSEQDESVAPASPNPRLFAVDGQAMEPFAQYMQKLRQQCDPRTYQQVLDILSTLHFKPDSTDEEEVSRQIARLFKDAPDLRAEFRMFMPPNTSQQVIEEFLNLPRFEERDQKDLGVTSNPLTDSFASLPLKRKRKATGNEKEQALAANQSPKKMNSTLRCDAVFGFGANANHGRGVAPASLNSQSYVRHEGVPSHQSCNDENSFYETYTNRGQHASGRGIINNINQYCPSNPLEELEKRCSPSAAFDSAARFNPPRCAASTRLGIIKIIEEWINSDGDDATPSSLFWLHGGAGVGKSALAQSLSEKFQEKEQLAASFFFFRSDPSRNNGDHLIPTLVSQLVDTFEGIVPFVEDRIRKNRALFAKKYQIQIQELLVKPLLALKSKSWVNHPRLIVIDGLDECENPAVQRELLRVIAISIPHIPYPLRFFVTSRPEAHIMRVFNHDPDLQAITVHRYNLSDDPDKDMDIRKFLEKEFVEIRRVHSVGQHLPHAWPDRRAITSLVERSSGHFIYTSTVIRYIQSPRHRPDDRLEVILRLRPPQEGDRPYDQLDALYELVFKGVETRGQLEKICLVLGILYFQSKRVGLFTTLLHYTIEKLLEMKPGDLVLLLDPILSLVAIDGENVRILHKSLFDYFLDFTRGGHLPFDLARVHEVAATYILKQKIMKDIANLYDFQDFAYHCRYAYLNDTLKFYLRSLEVPYPKSVMTSPKIFPPSDDSLNESLELITGIWHFFRTLSREDFDSTRKVYEQYMVKCMGYLQAVPRRTQPQSRAVARMDNLKPELDMLLTKWKPQNIGRMDVGMDPDKRLAFIKQEHSILSACSAVFSPTVIASSLVFGDCFIHSYDLGVSGNQSFGFLVLRTYFMHGNASYQRVYAKYPNIVRETQDYLGRVEKCLFSDLYQKYGLEPG